MKEKYDTKFQPNGTKDFTKGSIMKHLISLTVPLITGNILQQMYNTIDAFVIGRYAGEEEFAAVGVASSVINLFLFAIVGACIGISVLFAQLYGAGETKRFRQEHFISGTLGAVISFIMGIGGILFTPFLLSLLQTPKEVAGSAEIYLKIVLAALPMSFFYNFYSALFRAVGKVKVTLVILAAASVINFVLDIYFAAILHLGISGVAWATFFAQTMAALISFFYLKWRFPFLLFGKDDCCLDKRILRKTIYCCGTTAIQQTGLYLGKLFVQGAVNTMGTAAIAAYTAAIRIEGFANSFGDSGCSATSVVTAQNHGAQKEDRVRKTFWLSLILMILLGTVSSFLLYFAADPMIGFILGTKQPEAHFMGMKYMQIIAVVYIFCFIGNSFAGHFDGCGRMSITLIGTISQISIRTILSWIWIQKFGLGAVAVSAGLGWIFVTVFWTFFYRREKKKDLL